MTKEEFKNFKFTSETIVIYKGEEYHIISLDFEEDLIAIDEFPDEDDEYKQLSWKRFENVEVK